MSRITCAFGLYIWCAGADPADAGVFKSRKYCITPNSQTNARKEGSNHGGESLTKDANDERSKTVNATLSPSCLMVVLCLIPPALTCHCLSSEEESSQHQTSEDGIFFCSLCEVEAFKYSKHCRVCDKRVDQFDHHCRITLDVPTVGGRLMLVDMAGSENIEQAGQIGFEAKMQTAKINQGNTALKRVVESNANGDSHVPFRDSKLTMFLQDSFEDDKSKILMILCASPDPKEMHKTISTLEYGAKAKCIVRGPHTPIKGDDSSSSDVMLGSRIAAMDQFISKLQMENKIREKEKNEAHKQLQKKEEEITSLRAKLAEAEGKKSEEEINIKVNDMLKRELEKR
ncbi:putative protein S-acyltransferase [Helianthus annuus]|uniref:S-acyltransferase n=1 Tax=Helianthus annuus TaxID=4232 RepID=A0A9K3P1M1_HELAN|nr:putative protein S-acyltransferase [Helianthus annuus]KAJ0611041.1 putative protein S-acyltransferase [Helianthus annuus]KAJ0782651.1 putative protein S-acyltransferase [Helianthus annuus]KAJ0947278.1 putative protein S-acyltransferase [Helianthus annuus]